MKYNLAHLTQPSDQAVLGPIQDDEALFLFGLIRCTRINRILEVGGLHGYSAANFLAAVERSSEGVVYTVDIAQVPKLSAHHVVITKDATDLSAEDLDNEPVGLVFLDCHDFRAEVGLLDRLSGAGIINDHTYIAVHDTNLHPRCINGGAYEVAGGWVHQQCEREIVNLLHDRGWDCIPLETAAEVHDEKFPFRHGLTICRRFRRLLT